MIINIFVLVCYVNEGVFNKNIPMTNTTNLIIFKLLQLRTTQFPNNPCDLYVIVRQLPSPPPPSLFYRGRKGETGSLY